MGHQGWEAVDSRGLPKLVALTRYSSAEYRCCNRPGISAYAVDLWRQVLTSAPMGTGQAPSLRAGTWLRQFVPVPGLVGAAGVVGG
jgi:hypothetical protein